MALVRTTISIDEDTHEAGETRRKSIRKRSFSQYVEFLIEQDLAAAGYQMPSLQAAFPGDSVEVAPLAEAGPSLD